MTSRHPLCGATIIDNGTIGKRRGRILQVHPDRLLVTFATGSYCGIDLARVTTGQYSVVERTPVA